MEIETQRKCANFVAFGPLLTQVFMQPLKTTVIKEFPYKGLNYSTLNHSLVNCLTFSSQSQEVPHITFLPIPLHFKLSIYTLCFPPQSLQTIVIFDPIGKTILLISTNVDVTHQRLISVLSGYNVSKAWSTKTKDIRTCLQNHEHYHEDKIKTFDFIQNDHSKKFSYNRAYILYFVSQVRQLLFIYLYVFLFFFSLFLYILFRLTFIFFLLRNYFLIY